VFEAEYIGQYDPGVVGRTRGACVLATTGVGNTVGAVILELDLYVGI